MGHGGLVSGRVYRSRTGHLYYSLRALGFSAGTARETPWTMDAFLVALLSPLVRRWTEFSNCHHNLPALAPLCALFGIGMTSILEWQKLLRWRRTVAVAATLLVVLPAIPICQHLFKQDRQILAAALWTKENTQPGDVILFRPTHRWDMIEHP